MGPTKSANCLVNEVEVPDVRRLTAAEAQIRVEAQPLTPKFVYKPAAPRQRVGVVVDQRPKTGYRSSYDRILLVVSKATQGVIPNLVGKSLDDARPRLKKLKLEPRITLEPAASRRQAGDGARATAEGRRSPRRRACRSSSWSRERLRSAKRPAEVARARRGVPPRALGGDADPDPRPRDDLERSVRPRGARTEARRAAARRARA